MLHKLAQATQVDDGPPEAASDSVREIYAYWNRIRGDRAMPQRGDFDPIEVRGLLPGIMLVDVEGVRDDGIGIYRYRVVGEWEVEARGRNPTGQLIDDGFHYSSREAALADYDAVRTRRKPLFAELNFKNDRGIPVREWSVMLPFSEDGETVTQILVFSHHVSRE